MWLFWLIFPVVVFLSKDGATTFARVSFGVRDETLLVAEYASHTWTYRPFQTWRCHSSLYYRRWLTQNRVIKISFSLLLFLFCFNCQSNNFFLKIMIGLWSYTNFRLRNKECEVLLGGIVFFFPLRFLSMIGLDYTLFCAYCI